MAGQDFVVDPSFFEDDSEQKPKVDIANIAKRLGGFGVRGLAGVLGAEGGPLGAGINTAGEGIAQLIENSSLEKPYFGLDPRNLNKSAMAVAGAGGAIPGASLLKAGKMVPSALRSVGMAAAQTAAIKGAQDNPETGRKEIIENPNKVLNPLQWGALDLAGVGVAGGIGAAGAKLKMTPEAKAAQTAEKAAREAENAKFAAEKGRNFQWNKTAYSTRAEAEELATKHGGKVTVDKDGFHVVPGDFTPTAEATAQRKVETAKTQKQKIEELRQQGGGGVLKEDHTETITLVDPDTGAKVTYKRVLDTPTNKARRDSVQSKKEGLVPGKPTVKETTSAINPDTGATETATQSFAPPPPPKDGEDAAGLLPFGDIDPDAPVLGGSSTSAPSGGKKPALKVGGKKTTTEDLDLKVNEEGVVVPTTPAPERPSIFSPMEAVPEPKKPALKVKGAKGKKKEAMFGKEWLDSQKLPEEAGVPPPVEPELPKLADIPEAGGTPTKVVEPETTEGPTTAEGFVEPKRKSSRFYKQNPEVLDESMKLREQELADMPDPELGPLVLSENASPELRALAVRAAKLREMYQKAQADFKAGKVQDEVPAASATMKQGLLDEISGMEDAETARLLQKDLDQIAADDAVAGVPTTGAWNGVERRGGGQIPEGMHPRRIEDLANEMASRNPKLQGLADRISGKAEFDQIAGENVPKGTLKADGDGPGIVDRVRAERGTNKPDAVDPTEGKYDYSQPMMTLEEVAEATDTPIDTLNKQVNAKNPDKKLDTALIGGSRRVPMEWLNEWIALGNGGPGRRGRPPVSGQSGEIDPTLLASLGTGTVGSVVGSQYDEENPYRGAALGFLGGAAVPLGAKKVYEGGPATASKIGNLAHEGVKSLPDYLRFSLLSNPDSLFANTVVGPVGSGIWAGVEKALAGDPRGVRLLKEMKAWAPDFYDNVKHRRARDFIAEAERGEMSAGEDVNQLQKILSIPSEGMATGDLTTRIAARRAGFSPDEASRITLQSQDLNYATPRSIINFGRTQTEEGKTPAILKYMLPFKNTAANILDAGFDRMPGIGFLANKFGKDVGRQDTFREIAAKQGVGSAVGVMSYMLGKNVDPENAMRWRKYISNFAGPYSMVANAGFSAGLAAQEGATGPEQVFDAGTSAIGDFPLPTTRIPQELLKAGVAYSNGELLDPGLHPELEGPDRYLPKGFSPGILQGFYDAAYGSGKAGEDFGIGGLMRRAVQRAAEPQVEDDPFDVVE